MHECVSDDWIEFWLTASLLVDELYSEQCLGAVSTSLCSSLAVMERRRLLQVQGSKLRLPGYLSGKGFQSGEEGTLISAAVLKARNQTLGGE